MTIRTIIRILRHRRTLINTATAMPMNTIIRTDMGTTTGTAAAVMAIPTAAGGCTGSASFQPFGNSPWMRLNSSEASSVSWTW